MKYSFCVFSFDLMMLKHNHTLLHVKDSCRYFERCYSCVMWIPAWRCDIVRIAWYVAKMALVWLFSSHWTSYWHASHHSPSSRQYLKTLWNVKSSKLHQFVLDVLHQCRQYEGVLCINLFSTYQNGCPRGSLYEALPVMVLCMKSILSESIKGQQPMGKWRQMLQ